MKHAKFDIDLTSFCIDSMREVEKLILKDFKELLKLTLESDETRPYLPVTWDFGDNGSDGIGGPAVDDPLTIYLRVGFGDDELPTYKFSLREMAIEMIEGFKDGEGEISESGERPLKRFSDALRTLADSVDAELEP